jgi:hypothetical protein
MTNSQGLGSAALTVLNGSTAPINTDNYGIYVTNNGTVSGSGVKYGVYSNAGLNVFTGNTVFGGLVDAGFKLDVNGTARFSGKLLTLSVEDDFGGATTYVRRNSANLWFYTSSTAQGGIGAASGTGFRSIFLSGVYNGYSADAVYIGTSTVAGTYFQKTYMKIGGVPTSYIASSVLELDSTTRGFLPPRMTTTQKNAIATPAAGLMVYDTTLNLISVYNGTIWISL